MEKRKDGRVTRLEPLDKINHRRVYRTTRLYGRPRKVTTRPPHISLLKYTSPDLNSIYLKELSGIRRVLKILRKRQSEDDELTGLLNTLDELVDRRMNSRDPSSVLRSVRITLETHSLTKRLWDQLKTTRSRLPQKLSPVQEKVLKQLVDRLPDILLIMGNQLFLMLFAAVYETHIRNPSRESMEKLWDHLIPWQLVVIGFEPEYPPHHQTGRSVLHRPLLIDRLSRRVLALNDQITNDEVHRLHFGRAALVEEQGRPRSLFLTFQTRPRSREMNAIFLRLPTGSEGKITEVLRGLCRERPFWGESDLTRLGTLSDTVNLNSSVDIMVATHRGVRGLWVFDETEHKWTVIGRLDYYTRKRETVTLLMSVTLREDTELEDLSDERVRGRPSNLKGTIEIGLGTVSVVFRNCEVVKCRLSMDNDERMFRVSFLNQKADREIAHLLIKRTADVLEILRRPDFQCQQVVVDGHEMVWNRFNDIEYMGDTTVLRPWVERREPFKTVDLSLPTTAKHFIMMKRKGELKLTVQHDRGTCPLCMATKDELRKRSERYAGEDVTEHLRWIDGEKGQPEGVMGESIYRHGVCWRVGLESEEDLPKAMKQLETIAMSGHALATILETGLISNQTEQQEWELYELAVPESEKLPREFRESIHLMRWRQDTAVLPGQYILEEWEPDISLGIDKITLSLESQITREKQTRFVYSQRSDQMHPECLRELLENEMQKLVDGEGLEEDKRLRKLIQELIEDVVELAGESRVTTWNYEGLGWVTKGYSERMLEVVFSTPEGERIDVQVTQGIHVYLDWVKFSGRIDREIVSDDVSAILSQYDVKGGDIEEVIENVIAELEKEGVVFIQEL